MLGRSLCAGVIAACACGAAWADEPGELTAIFETQASVRFWWTEFVFFDDSPKAWDAIASPELYANLRVLEGPFEAKIEIGALADRFTAFTDFDADSLRALVSFGWNSGDWSFTLEWEGFDVFEPGIGVFYLGFNTYDLRVSKRFAETIIEDLPPGLFQASLTGGYVASTFDPLQRRFAKLELEWFQPFGDGAALVIAPKLELSEYPEFGVEGREDAVLTLRVAPTYNLRGGVTLSLEGQGSFAFSSSSNKTGETWSITPMFRFQTAL